MGRRAHEEKFGPVHAVGDVGAEIVLLIRAGDRIGAIKAYRQQTGCDLQIAKDKIEAIARDLAAAKDSHATIPGIN